MHRGARKGHSVSFTEEQIRGVQENWRKLTKLALVLNVLRRSLRDVAGGIAGVPLEEWSIADLEKYVELGAKKYLKIPIDRR